MKNIELACLSIAVEYPDIAYILLRNADEGLWITEDARAAFGVLSGLYEEGDVPTWPLILDLLPAAGVKQASIDGMIACLAGIPGSIAEQTLRDYVSRLKTNRAKREALREIARQAQGPVFDLGTIKEIIAEAEMNAVHDEDPAPGTAYDEYVKWITSDNAGVRTGFPSFDKLTDGMNYGELAAILARTRVGKTWAALNMLARVSTQLPDEKMAFFSLEMPKSGIAERLMQLAYNKSRWEIKPDVRLDPARFRQEFIQAYPNVLIFGGVYGVDEIRALAKKHESRVIFIDFMGLLKPRDGDASLYQQATQKMIDLKHAAKDLGALIVLLVQLNRTAGYGNTAVTLDMARESGAIEELSDFIYGLWDPGLDPDQEAAWRNRIQMAMLKSKRSVGWQIRVHFDRVTGKMIEEAEND